jgi:hypothetical protein
MCDATLSDLQQLQKATFCGERCRWQYATMPAGQRCKVCGRRLSSRESAAGVCASLECRYKVDEPIRERRRQEHAAHMQRAGELRDRQAARLGLEEPETYLPAVIPSFERRVTNLPERRRRAFRDFLNRLISEATESRASSSSSDAGPPAAPAPPGARELERRAVLARACAVCQGYCCGFGGNHAYLSVETIRRYMAEHPDQRPRDVLAAYLSHVGNKTFEGSCVYHQPGGCSLPRAMRADICDYFYCPGLTDYENGLAGQDRARGFFVSMDGDEIRAAAFCDRESSRIVDLPPAPENELGPPSVAGV